MMVPDTPLAAHAGDGIATQRRARRATLITLGALIVLVTLVILLTPVNDNSFDTRLTTLRYGPGNARLASDLAKGFGWRVTIADQPLVGALDSTSIYLVFAGPTPMATRERVAVLDAVRRGAGLLVAPGSDGEFALLDSLGLRTGTPGTVDVTPLGACPAETDPLAALRVRPMMQTFTITPPTGDAARTAVPYPLAARRLLSSDVKVAADDDDTDAPVAAAPEPERLPRDEHESRPTIVAFPLGRGRVVALADPDMMRTDQLRSCAQGSALSIVRGLEYLSDGRKPTLVVAEFYQRESTDSVGVVVWEWLRFSGLGRSVLTLISAAVLLLLARGRRTLAPVYHVREERRSALEHVDALATAWRAVRGTRTVARMLARGIRRRHAAGRWRTLDDTEFLAALAERHPSIADDAARLTRAIDAPAVPSDLPALRAAAAHIDAECLTP
ncbi:MAG: hypothetical protein H7099_03215 [Gemmatimonadaceae bacterium]|nr:hypothetical protein [Gemmatimonadaceae bacterium]